MKCFWLQINIPNGNYRTLWTDGAASCQKVQKSDFQSQFLCQKWCESFQKNFIENINLGAHFLTTSIFKTLFFLKWCPIFADSLLHQFTKLKYNNFLLEHWFLGKKPIWFCIPLLKTRQPKYKRTCSNIGLL